MFSITQKEGECLWIGLSTETKPAATAGHMFLELDTNRTYVANGSAFVFAPTGGTASQFLRGDGTWASPAGGGSDPWTYIKLASDFPTSLATFSDITGMTFTPAANTDYEVEWCLMGQTATTTVGLRPGVSYGTGYQYGVVDLYTPSSATAEAQVHGSMTTVAGTVQAPVGGLPIINRTYGHRGYAMFRSGATPTAFKLQLASETAATAVTVKAGSFMKYRTI